MWCAVGRGLTYVMIIIVGSSHVDILLSIFRYVDVWTVFGYLLTLKTVIGEMKGSKVSRNCT